jgi:small subunit ribosomal protein S1
MSEENKKPEAVDAPEVQEVATEATIEVTETTPVAKEETQEDFLNNFDWYKYEEGIEAVDETKLKEFEKALEGIQGFVKERDVIEGTVIRKTDRDAIIDINSKCVGVFSLIDFR